MSPDTTRKSMIDRDRNHCLRIQTTNILPLPYNHVMNRFSRVQETPPRCLIQ